MEFHLDYPPGFETSKKRPFFEATSFQSPESYKWWRKVSATKSIPSSTEKIKKTPFPKMENGEKSKINPFLKMENKGVNLKIKGNVDDFELKDSFLSDEKSKKTQTQFPKMENKGGNAWKSHNLMKENVDEERTRVLKTLQIFREKCMEISQSKAEISQKRNRVDFRARTELLKQGKIRVCSSKILGCVPGVKVGDRFEYRVELSIVGLQGRSQHGIDYMKYGGQTVATGIVAREGYADKMSDTEMITYMGEGGIVKTKEKVFYEDQKLIRGNLALYNSMIAKTDVRVVRGVKHGAKFGNWRSDTVTYIYDGLYRVVSYDKMYGSSKNLIFEFKLVRCPGQPAISWYKYKNV